MTVQLFASVQIPYNSTFIGEKNNIKVAGYFEKIYLPKSTPTFLESIL